MPDAVCLRLDSWICGQSYGVTAYLQLCLAQTVFEVEKGSVLGSAELLSQVLFCASSTWGLAVLGLYLNNT